MLKQNERLKKDRDFKSIYKRSKKKSNRFFTIYYRDGSRKVGIVVSKKHGNAVKRNLLKRRIRAILFEVFKGLANYEFIIIPKVGAKDLDYDDLKKNLKHILSISGLLR